ncbi:hypothetical protein OG949_18625 [Streptomyces scopuliridis]|uniref:hypothetical protein n=1 Tax=Streptomyces scopuliridis TaxID=452529 RepID=UPI002DD8F9F3|nr:hypothetical protein [Streptomyces scopuliridis]WSB34684.1 hypothetical protein OG949_18625 [Streptomyces scopuliridis]
MTAVGDRNSGTRAGHEPGAEDERELRILLEKAVPRLPAPEGRLHGVRERVARNRRRRRTAGAAAAAVTGLALAGTLLPGVPRAPESTPPASSAPSVTAPPDTGPSATPPPSTAPPSTAPPDTASPPPTPSDAWDRRTRFAHVAGLALRLPDTWQALDVPEDARYKQPARGFVSTQRLVPYDLPCPGNDPSLCLPAQALRPGGALVTLVADSGTGLSAKIQDPPALYPSAGPSPACRKIAGTREFTGLIGGAPAPFSAVVVTVCVAGDSPGTVEDAHAMITGADFGRAVETAPTTAEHPPNAR